MLDHDSGRPMKRPRKGPTLLLACAAAVGLLWFVSSLGDPSPAPVADAEFGAFSGPRSDIPRTVSANRFDSTTEPTRPGAPDQAAIAVGARPSAPRTAPAAHSPRPARALVLESIPSTPEKMLARVLEVSDDWSADGSAKYFDFIDSLRADRALSASMLEAAYAVIPPERQDDHEGRRVIYALGHVAHETSLPFLERIALAPLPPGDHDTHLGGPRTRAEISHGMALRAMHAIAARYNTPEVVTDTYEVANELLARVADSHYLALVAADMLLTGAKDPSAERRRIQSIFGPELAELLDIEVKSLHRGSP